MTNTHLNRPPVTVPIGFGGKTTPYVPDPAPTLVIEFPSVETGRELARIASLETAAREAADRIAKEARADAERLRRAADEAAEQIRTATESERQTALAEIAADREAIAAEWEDLARKSEDLADRGRELERGQSTLNDRLDRADEDVAEAVRLLATAGSDAETILREAQTTADSMLQEAVSQAQTAATDLIGQARDSVDADQLASQRLAEVEAMHRVEVQVLTEREAELLNRIAQLEAKLASGSETIETTTAEPVDDHVAISLEHEGVAVEIPEQGMRNRRHSSEIAETGTRAMASHAPLTEQLSTSVFRTVAERDRKGKRRR